jgi:flagellar hook-associated protein 2
MSVSKIRLTGMATGMDTDTTVKQMMAAYQSKVDKMKQDKQTVSWKQDLYRDILSDVNTFKSSYFDVVKYDSYMLSKNSFSGYKIEAKSSVDGQPAGVSVTAGTGAAAGAYSVKVIELAETAKLDGTALNVSSNINLASWQGDKTIDFRIGSDTAQLTFNVAAGTTNEALRDLINTKIASEPKLAGKISASLEGTGVNTKIKFNALTDTEIKIDSSSTVDDVSLMKGKVINPKKDTTKLSALGINTSASDLNFTLDYTDSTGVVKTKIITIAKASDITISALLDKVSSETSGNVVMKYSELSGSFSIETLGKGTTASLKVTDTNDIFKNLNITTAGIVKTGENAKAEITDPAGNIKTIEKSSNTFTLDSITYNLLKENAVGDNVTTNTVTVSTDVQKPFDKIKSFIDKYNEMIDKISTKISEKKQYTYLPLTEEQKKDMSEDDIKAWETKAKQGLLKNDGMLENMLTSLRGAFYEKVKDAGISLTEIGLSTSSDTSQRGKIIIDDTKLKNALTTRGDQVAALFSKTSTTHPSFNADLNSGQRKERSEEEGIFQKIQDIFQDYTRTMRDKDGKKGLLLEKAGLKGDMSEFKNLLTKDLDDRQKRIDDFLDKMAHREDRYYQQFAKLESAMNNMNSQSSWLAQQLGNNN